MLRISCSMTNSVSACHKNNDNDFRAKRLQERQETLRELLDKENH